ncbi:MAG: hypothetical protein AABZ60_17325 [Planctomycetota bacterium]
MKLVFRDIQNTRDLIFEAPYYHLELSEIVQELQQKYPHLQGRLLQLSYAGQPLEFFWTLDYLIKQFQLKEFDVIQLQKEQALHQIETIEDLLEVKEDVLGLVLKEIPRDLLQEHFPDLPGNVQAKILKNSAVALREVLEKTKPSRNSGDSFSLLQAFIYEGELMLSREKEEKATHKLKKLLRKKDVFFSSVVNSGEPVEEEINASASIDETLSRLSSQVFETQKEIQHQENLEQHLFTQIQKKTSSQKEFLESLLQEEELSYPQKIEKLNNPPEEIPVSEEKVKSLEMKVVDQLFEDKKLQESLPSFPVETFSDETKTLEPIKDMDHLFEDLELPLNTPTGHHIEEFFQEKILEENPAVEMEQSHLQKPPVNFSTKKQDPPKKISVPLPIKEIPTPKVPLVEKEEPLLESKEYILSKQQLLAAGHALHRPPPLKKQRLIASPDDSDATLPVQTAPRLSYLQVQERKEKIQESQNPIPPVKYHLLLDLSFPKIWSCLEFCPIYSDLEVQCVQGASPKEFLPQIQLEFADCSFSESSFPVQLGKNTHQFSLMGLKPELLSGKILLRWNQKNLGEFPLEIRFLSAQKKVPLWMLAVSGLIGSLGYFTFPYGMVGGMGIAWVYLFFFLDKTASTKTPFQQFHFDIYASI